jgi:hypothetical protein
VSDRKKGAPKKEANLAQRRIVLVVHLHHPVQNQVTTKTPHLENQYENNPSDNY